MPVREQVARAHGAHRTWVTHGNPEPSKTRLIIVYIETFFGTSSWDLLYHGKFARTCICMAIYTLDMGQVKIF